MKPIFSSRLLSFVIRQHSQASHQLIPNPVASLSIRKRYSSSSPSKMETVRETLAQNFGGVAHGLAKEENQFDIDNDVPDLSGKVAVVTGGSEGIGYAATFVMLRNNLEKVFILSPSKEVIDGALKDITEKLGSQYADRVKWIQLDLSDFKATTEAAAQISSSSDRLDILIMNAARGVMTYQLTEYGLDRHMALNHVAHVTLCSHLLPLLKSTADKHGTVRIHLQSSNAHQNPGGDVKFASDDEMNQDLGPQGQYGRSKLANLLYARYLDRHLHREHPKILINATHPGFVETKMSIDDIHEPYPILGYAMSTVVNPFKKDQWLGSASTLYAATKTENSGEYICPPATAEAGSEYAQDAELGEQLMKWTRDYVRTKFGSESVDKGCPLRDY